INDRWDPPLPGTGSAVGRRIYNGLFAKLASRMGDQPFLPGRHRLADFRTPEYSLPAPAADYRWEATRGLGAALGYHATETDAHRIDPDELLALYGRIRRAGGNLLLNVGPTADGTIIEAETSRVRCLGAHLGAG